MASFSFGAGNVRTILSIPLYAVGRVLTLVIPRTRRNWVFGCHAGVGDGAWALWQVAAEHGESMIWLTGSPKEAADAGALGIPHLPKNSFRGFCATARARVVVISYGFGDVSRYAVTGAFVVNLWHGIPLKRIGLDSEQTVRVRLFPHSTLLRGLVRGMYRVAMRRTRILPAASHLVRGRLESAFALSDAQVPVTGEPRVDVLSHGSSPELRSTAREALAAHAPGMASQTQLILYAPTWRDGQPDPAIPNSTQWSQIQEMLERTDSILLIRSHRMGSGNYLPPLESDRIGFVGSDVVADITPLLPGLDVLVTDYSSLAYDAGLIPLPTVFLATDAAEYAKTRGFYGSYHDVTGGTEVTDWAAAVAALAALCDRENPEHARKARERSSALSATVHAFRDGQNSQRVYRAIVTGLASANGTGPR